MSNDKYDSIKVVKVDCSTSCDDLVNPPMKPFKCDLCNGNGGIVESCNDELALENEFLKSKNDKLKQQVVDLMSGYKTLSNGHRLHLKQTRIGPKGQRSNIAPSVDKMVIFLLNARLHLLQNCGRTAQINPAQVH
ncbi:hypothetical protein GQ55_4G210500 [Panicum hallii var. hallii]|uniref:Uncharacterized protein n=1 Tax=Panicum hallii var. hallii TaxID=1504633 RepID=A0A2T7DZ95_9POAL|nr:hypothetical protein GQ55_4G210500 [Panicum hallii var. hallii]